MSVSAHGCNLRLTTPVARGQEIALVNKKTAEELPCTVTFIGQRDAGKLESWRGIHRAIAALLAHCLPARKIGIPLNANALGAPSHRPSRRGTAKLQSNRMTFKFPTHLRGLERSTSCFIHATLG